ncbi:GAF domain-containing protein [Hymenobacter sp. BT175]|uniref:GAF domain-containing protein n=1 Tax=Hymenobacter translucens TaxID=2886507 RepID=UPI001D0E4881|nr:GAF domain-containing protein [Hymenobacter translucens]MCC2546203.1 GAF domain-containing protein [Hymenobacter translucens]
MPVDKSKLVPANEPQRLQALARYSIAGTAPEKLFDDWACLVAKLFETPIALVSLVTQDEVFFKANYGLPGAVQVPREDSMCSVAVLKEEPVVYEDLNKKPCDLVNPQVAQSLNLRFYAGVPLRDPQGHTLGSLCVIDREARKFTEQETELLTRLAAVTMRTIELRLAAKQQVNANNAQLQLAYDALHYSMDRISDLVREKKTGVAATDKREKEFRYRVASEILDYVNRFVGGTLTLV